MKEGRRRAIAKQKGEEESRAEQCSAVQCGPTEKSRNIPSGNFEMVKKKDSPPPLPIAAELVHDP